MSPTQLQEWLAEKNLPCTKWSNGFTVLFPYDNDDFAGEREDLLEDLLITHKYTYACDCDHGPSKIHIYF